MADLAINGGSKADTITGSDSVDVITGGAGNDTITTGLGADTVTLGTGSADTVMDFLSGTDKLDLTAHVASTTETTIAAGAADQDALANAEYFTFNVDGTAADLTVGGTKTVSDFSNETQVAAYLSEQFTVASGGGAGDKSVFVINDSTSGNSYIYIFTEDGAGGIVGAEIELVGILDSATATGGDYL